MKLQNLLMATAAVALMASCKSGGFGGASLKTEKDSLSYAFGVFYGNVFQQNGLEEVNFDAFSKGAQDGFSKDSADDKFTREGAMEFINNYFQKMEMKKAAENLEKGNKFLEENKTKDGVIVDSSGLQYKVLTEGNGAQPKETDVVKVHYHGTLIDGTVFDSSVERGEPAQFPLDRVIRGWTIGVQKMKVGSKYMLYIPADLGYGMNVRPGGKLGPNETLIFEVELLDIVKENKK